MIFTTPSEISNDANEFCIIFHQTEQREIEKWFLENSGFQNFDPKQIKIQDINIAQYVRGYIENEEYDMLFKLLIVFCNLLRIPYYLDNDDMSCDFIFRFKKADIIKRIQIQSNSERGKLMVGKLLELEKK